MQFTYQTMSLRQKFLLVSESPGADTPFDDVLAHIICFVTVAEDVIPFIIPKTVKKDKKVISSHVRKTNLNK